MRRNRLRMKTGESEDCCFAATMASRAFLFEAQKSKVSRKRFSRKRLLTRLAGTHAAAVRILFEDASISRKIAEIRSPSRSKHSRATRRLCRTTLCRVSRAVNRNLSPTWTESNNFVEMFSKACKGESVRTLDSVILSSQLSLIESQHEQVGAELETVSVEGRREPLRAHPTSPSVLTQSIALGSGDSMMTL